MGMVLESSTKQQNFHFIDQQTRIFYPEQSEILLKFVWAVFHILKCLRISSYHVWVI